MPEPLCYTLLAPRVNDTFQVPGAVDLQLIDCRKLTPHPAVAEPFALTFRGPASPVLQQQIYSLTHPELGDSEIFLVPIGPDKQGMLYEAIFN